MSEYLHLTLGDEEYESRPDNTTLFTFLGRSAIRGVEIDHNTFNHIFFQKGESEETMVGSYMFRTPNNAGVFDTILSHIASEDYPMVLNRRDVPDCDVDAYYRMVDQVASQEEIEDFFPDDWLNEDKS